MVVLIRNVRLRDSCQLGDRGFNRLPFHLTQSPEAFGAGLKRSFWFCSHDQRRWNVMLQPILLNNVRYAVKLVGSGSLAQVRISAGIIGVLYIRIILGPGKNHYGNQAKVAPRSDPFEQLKSWHSR